ncbi:hypothetical protein ABB37_07778 [Leptomonas pyrrhocoris]|uniref:Uncharacterized protein n=1 Tax=Leptomonas pyrrhocoris TaxID=157538 RepID=A0A0M9FUX3_LEPPY|nr:hypothetical protein ABB37_07778 [Leptomonas pyrrhocoris]XP_015654898.1 hypothetical protein ABB37_07778 [Leptomonas pyrrhocoris]KPA76458.1 hypothetical protein ABB37_07778 [Leptomonas pyrrhocoris]KPA76459.1 hypothetical protein ABB37_07778 [Leptomonas pyrrhocoris]|eukprot:XP_015654897.1 hypothetical protein ABB37_07778 [Leptomonas pyrrhocoris]
MYKQRDNEYHPPMTSDPTGSGIVSSAFTAHTNSSSDDIHNNVFAGPAVAAGSRKRGRDIRGLERFRSVVYGEDGFRRLHAMVARNPVLVYPPEGIEEARARVAGRLRAAQEQQQLQDRCNLLSGGGTGKAEVEEDVFALFDERRAAEQQQQQEDTLPSATLREAAQQPPLQQQQQQSLSSLAALRRDEELAKNHHKQLDSFLRLLYEFNHVSFVKLPMEDTLQLLSRCGKEAVAHVLEYETQVRLKRQVRLRELTELQEEANKLATRRMAAEEAEQARELAAAEQRQAELDLFGLDPALDPLPQENADTNREVQERLAAAPQVHFALDEKVKEEEEEKDTDLVEATGNADVPLPVVRDDGDERAPPMPSNTSAFAAPPPAAGQLLDPS